MICAIGAIDVALWDIRGQAEGAPVARVLGGDPARPVTPYASLLPDGHTLEAYRASLVDKAVPAKRLGFRALKLEVCLNGPYSHHGLQENDESVVDVVAECRRAVGTDIVLMVDVAYAWPDARTALGVIERLAPFDLAFVETPIDIDDLAG
jgi:L-alanine-DL-glutamate epimerase-like enolase superfamily enzyme